MKQLLFLGVAAVLAAFLAAGGLTGGSSGTVHADPFNNVFTYKTTWSTLASGSSPNLDVQVGIDCPLGSGACPASTNAPFFDIAVTQYGQNIHGCDGTATAVCPATKIPYDATLGTTDFQLNTNIIAAKLPSNVDTVTGTTAACGGPGTTTLVSTFTIYNSNNTASALINSKDDAQNVDTDSLPDSQADSYGVTAAGALTNGANGVPDGADGLPDYIKLVLDTALPILSNRGYGVAQIVPQAAQTDVNFLTLNLGTFGAGYAAITTLGDVRPLVVPDPDASQATVTCAPFTSTVHTLGTSADSFGTSWTANGNTVVHNTHETPQPVREIQGAGGTAIHYAIDVSSAEDVDGDGIPLSVDRCPNPEVGTFTAGLTSASGSTDTDGDGMGDSCDPNPATANNCPGVSFTGRSTACAADASAGPYPTGTSNCAFVNPGSTSTSPLVPPLNPNVAAPATYTENGDTKNDYVKCTSTWLPDQDIDGDNFANFFDNCPTTYNPDQIDQNSDGVGDACQTTVNTAAGPRPPRPLHDHDDFCDNATTVGGVTSPATTCYANATHGAGVINGALTSGLAQDSNDDGFPDYLVGAGFTLTDKNSDSDGDGCSDLSEVSQTAFFGACGSSFGVASGANPGLECGVGIAICLNPKKSNTNGNNDCGNGPTITGTVVSITGTGGTVTYAANTVTDTSKTFEVNSLANHAASAGGNTGTGASNTATKLTLGANWNPSTPGAGTAYSINGYTANGFLDATKSFTGNALAGKTVATSDGKTGTIGTNTATTVTLTAPWTGGQPAEGASYAISPGGGIYLPSYVAGGANAVQDTAHCVDGGKDDPNGVADVIDTSKDATQVDNTSNPNGGTADSDGDGCTNRREALGPDPLSNGGGRNPLNKWDFFDVDTNNAGTLGKNKVISIADTIAILQYVGTNATSPNSPNSNHKTYAGDDNVDGISNGLTFDRSPAATFSGPPNGAVTIADAIGNLNQIGANCSTP